MSIEKERKAFESQNFIKRLLGYSKYDEDRNEYVYFRFEDYAIRDTCELNTAWKAWQASANREGYKLVDKKKLAKVLNCVTDDWLIDTGAMNEFKEIESLVADEVESMIGACDE